MDTSKKDPFLEKIKQYAVDELTTAENQGGVGLDPTDTTGDPNNRKGAFSSLLLPHEWLRVDHAYDGAKPMLPASEYRAMAEV